VDMKSFESHRYLINDPVLEKRALHVISENERVKEAKDVLSKGQLVRFGELMYASHESLKDLYEVSGKELDTIVDFAKTYEGCIGARMTGAGFGGCAIALVKKGQFDDFAEKLTVYYKNEIGYGTDVFASEIGDGVKAIG
jgi:galactokinase